MKKKQPASPQSQDNPLNRGARGGYFFALLAGGSRLVSYGVILILFGSFLSAVYAVSPNVKSTMWKIVFLAPLALVVAWILYVCSPFAGGKRIKGDPPEGTERRKELAERDRKLYRGWFSLSVIPAAVISAGLVWVIGEQQRLDTAHAAVIFAVLLVASVSLIGIVRRQRHFRRCSTCGKSWALKRTGQRTEPPNPQEEWRCRHCDWTIWIDVVHGDMSGGHGGGW